MKKLIFLSLLVLYSCAKEDSQSLSNSNSIKLIEYTLTVTAGDGGTVNGGGTFTQGTQVTITANSNSGYTFGGWSNGSNDNPLTVILNSNISISANFEQLPSFNLTVNAQEGGEVSSNGGDYPQGTLISLTAIPSEGFIFTGWSNGLTDQTIDIVMVENIELTALFDVDPFSYSGYSYDYIELTSPPFDGTIYVTGDIIIPTDPNLFDSIEYVDQSKRNMYDRRIDKWEDFESFNFNAFYKDNTSIEVQVNPEFEYSDAENLALKYASLVGQLSTGLRRDVKYILIHDGEEGWGGGYDVLLIHNGFATTLENWWTGNIIEETLLHEAAHASLDNYIYGDEEWDNAVAADQTYISTYAEDYPLREDVAELLPLYIAVKYFPSRISRDNRSKILSCCINRILYLDNVNIDLEIYTQ